ncbi:TIGR03663 family protein [Chloroflexi bacterium]|nr:TIGR03663 family protein [Chloroflexota bacterium]
MSRPFSFEGAIFFCIFIAGLTLRLYEIGTRTMHHDESLHAYFSWELFQGSGLIHNPMLHGPLQMELTSLIFFLFGDSDTTARLLYVVVGSVLILLPALIRDYLGKYGAIITSLLIAISPTMVYFSRFARNDILMGLLTFYLVIVMWKYLDSGNKKNLYVMSGLLALCFATKESAYLIVGILGLYLTITTIYESFTRRSFHRPSPGLSYPNFMWSYTTKIFKTLKSSLNTQPYSRSFTILILLISLTLPQWSAFSGLIQETMLMSWSNIVLVSGEGSPNIGMPSHGGKLLAFLLVVALIMASVYLGFKWHWKTWWKCALIFYLFWLAAYTTFFTNISGGVQSGIWQSLGYWIVQQGEARGGQPSTYYLYLIPIYEYLPAIFCALATLYYLKSRDRFNLFLVYWSITTLLIYTIASEKMPWLLVNIALPMIILSGKFLGDLTEKVRSQLVFTFRQFINFLLPTLTVATIFLVAKYSASLPQVIRIPIALAMILFIIAALIYVVKLSRHSENDSSLTFMYAGAAILLMFLTIRTTIYVNYVNSDIPVEMLVYTQTSPDILLINNAIDEQYPISKSGINPLLVIDQTSGFTWPWSWYLRNRKNVQYPIFNPETNNSHEQATLVMVHSSNQPVADKALSKDYKPGVRITHRWWFPENTYRDLNSINLATRIADTKHWNIFLEYWLFRKGVGKSIGSEDAYLYTKENFPSINFVGATYRD